MKFFLWTIAHESVNTQDKIQRRYPYISISRICVCCTRGMERFLTTSFSTVTLAEESGSILASLLGLRWCLPWSLEEWTMDSLNGGGLTDKMQVLWSNASKAILWLLWKERSVRILADKPNSSEYLCDLVVHKHNRQYKLFCNYTTLLINLDWKV